VLLGRLHGVPTPVNEAVVAATRALAHAGREPRTLDAAEVLASL
jgi:2-dehydropantoate 2-reductase